jgi:hypothetical protein
VRYRTRKGNNFARDSCQKEENLLPEVEIQMRLNAPAALIFEAVCPHVAPGDNRGGKHLSSVKSANLLLLCSLSVLLFFLMGCQTHALSPPTSVAETVQSQPFVLAAFESGLAAPDSDATKIKVPFLGEIDARDYSLPALAVLLGLIDGFNPCAMWALVYLISLVASLNDRRKIWLIVGSFVLSSGILYFLFMSAWLNAFLVMGYFRPITIIIGIVAVYLGLAGLVDLIRKKGALTCEVVSERSKQKTIDRMKSIVLSPVTVTSVLSTVALAFIVNSIEFVCSCAIPVVFTHVLSMSGLTRLEHYSYILLYDFFFMLDDLIIFGSAALALNTVIANRYVVYCKIVGGILMTVLGLALVFMPQVLMM